MKRLVFSKEKEEKERKRQRFLAVLIGIIMALSTAGFALNFTSGERSSYKGLKFYQTEQGWQPKGFDIVTTYLPQDVENITSTGGIQAVYFDSKVYLIALPYLRNDAREFIINVPMQNVQQACLPENENDEFCLELPTKSCEDADSQNVMLILKEGNQSSITYGGYCLTIEGESGELLKAVDKAIFLSYGIIK